MATFYKLTPVGKDSVNKGEIEDEDEVELLEKRKSRIKFAI